MAVDDPFDRRLSAGLRNLLEAAPLPHPEWATAPAAQRVRGDTVARAPRVRSPLWLLAAAVMVAVVGSILVVSGGRGPSVVAVATPTTSATATGTLVPSASPTSAASLIAGAPCGATDWAGDDSLATQPQTSLQALEAVRLVDDTISFDVTSLAHVSVVIEPVQPPFQREGSGAPLTVRGATFWRIAITGVQGEGLPTAQLDQSGSGVITELVETGDFEGVSSWIVGTPGSCAHLYVIRDPATLQVRLDIL